MHPGNDVGEAALQRWWQPALKAPTVEEPRRAVAGVALSAAPAAPAALIESGFHLLAPMRELGGPHHQPGRIVDHGEASSLAARIDLEPQRVSLLVPLPCLEDQCEGVTPEHGRPSPRKQMPGAPRMHRSARPPLVVHDQDHRHDAILSDSPCGGNVPLVLVCTRYCASPTGLSTPSTCLRRDLQDLGLRRHPKVRTQTLRANGSWLTPGDWSALGLSQAPAVRRGVADRILPFR